MSQKLFQGWRLAIILVIALVLVALDSCGGLDSGSSNNNRRFPVNANTSNSNTNGIRPTFPNANVSTRHPDGVPREPRRKTTVEVLTARENQAAKDLAKIQKAKEDAYRQELALRERFERDQRLNTLQGTKLTGRTDNGSETNRYPTIESPDQVPVNHEFAVQVSLTSELISPDVKVISGDATNDRRQLRLKLPTQDNWPIEVVLSAPEFEILDGKNQATLILPKDGDAPPAVFQLRPKPISIEQQSGHLFATFYFNGTFLGRALREVTITNSNSSATQIAPSKPLVAPGAGRPLEASRPESRKQLEVDSYAEVPGLTVTVRDYPGMAHTDTSEIQIDSPRIPLNVSQFPRPSGLETWLNSKYREFARLSSRSSQAVSGRGVQVDRETAASLLRGFGRELYQKFAPPAFKEAFWKLVDESNAAGSNFKFKSIQIYSDNPLLPWELMRPVRADGSDERDFLGVEFDVGRWHVSEGGPLMDKPPQVVQVAGLYLIAPEYQGPLALPGQQDEIAELSAFHGYQRIPGQFHQLGALLTDSPAGIIHFAGHGVIKTGEENVPEYFILLEDGDLDPTRWRGIVTTRTNVHQFVFFNACDVGQVSRIANFVNGWAPAVLETGASGYVGALWPLGDKAAANFAIHFYQALEQRSKKGPVTVADVLRDTRRLFLTDNDPTYLAYVYYGDPNLKLDIR